MKKNINLSLFVVPKEEISAEEFSIIENSEDLQTYLENLEKSNDQYNSK